MSVSSSAFEYLWIESVPLTKDVCQQVGHKDTTELIYRMEKHGFNVGRGLGYVYMQDETEKLTEIPEIMRFLSAKFWPKMFNKPVDNLKTNHRQAYILVDNAFPMCMRMSTNLRDEHVDLKIAPYLWFPCGLIRGFLHSLGLNCDVEYQVRDLPHVDFIIRLD